MKDNYNVCLMGLSQTGKSAIANVLGGKRVFDTHPYVKNVVVQGILPDMKVAEQLECVKLLKGQVITSDNYHINLIDCPGSSQKDMWDYAKKNISKFDLVLWVTDPFNCFSSSEERSSFEKLCGLVKQKMVESGNLIQTGILVSKCELNIDEIEIPDITVVNDDDDEVSEDAESDNSNSDDNSSDEDESDHEESDNDVPDNDTDGEIFIESNTVSKIQLIDDDAKEIRSESETMLNTEAVIRVLTTYPLVQVLFYNAFGRVYHNKLTESLNKMIQGYVPSEHNIDFNVGRFFDNYDEKSSDVVIARLESLYHQVRDAVTCNLVELNPTNKTKNKKYLQNIQEWVDKLSKFVDAHVTDRDVITKYFGNVIRSTTGNYDNITIWYNLLYIINKICHRLGFEPRETPSDALIPKCLYYSLFYDTDQQVTQKWAYQEMSLFGTNVSFIMVSDDLSTVISKQVFNPYYFSDSDTVKTVDLIPEKYVNSVRLVEIDRIVYNNPNMVSSKELHNLIEKYRKILYSTNETDQIPTLIALRERGSISSLFFPSVSLKFATSDPFSEFVLEDEKDELSEKVNAIQVHINGIQMQFVELEQLQEKYSVVTQEQVNEVRMKLTELEQLQEQDSVVTQEQDSIVTQEQDSVVTQEQDSIVTQEQDSVVTQEQDSIVTQEQDSIVTQEQDSIVTQEQDSIVTQEQVNEGRMELTELEQLQEQDFVITQEQFIEMRNKLDVKNRSVPIWSTEEQDGYVGMISKISNVDDYVDDQEGNPIRNNQYHHIVRHYQNPIVDEFQNKSSYV